MCGANLNCDRVQIEDLDVLATGVPFVNILRRLPLSRLLLLCALAVALGASATAIAFALGSGPTPPPKPLAQAVHDALAAPPVEGVSANVTLTDHLLEGAGLTGGAGEAGGELSSSPLLSGASGRLWVAKDGRVRLELQAEKGDTQVLYDGRTLTVYDASSNTLYRFSPHAAGEHGADTHASPDDHEAPSVAKIEEAIAKLHRVDVSGATPTDVAGQAAYTVRVSPTEGGSMIGGAEVSWDAVHGVPLRMALYSSTSSSPVLELTASSVSYGAVPDSVFEVKPPANAKVEEVTLPSRGEGGHARRDGSGDHEAPKLTTRGEGITGVGVLESPSKPGEKAPQLSEQLPKVKIGGASATELPTPLGTLLTFERDGVRYLLAGAVTPAGVEAVARGL
jgi:outer membrane lipoprotein-sorting protein